MKQSLSTYLNRQKHWIGLAAILAVALALRIPNLTESIWFDELWATHIKLIPFSRLAHTIFINIHPPLYNTFMYLWINLFGDSELSIRLPFLLFGLGDIVMTFLLAGRYFGRKAGLLAAALLALSPTHIWYSQEARCYTMLMFLILLAVYAYSKYDQDRARGGWFWTFAVSLFAAVFTHYYAVAFAGFMALLSLRKTRKHARDWRDFRACLVPLGLLAALMLAKLIGGHLRTSADYLREFGLFELWMLLLDWFPTGHSLWLVNMWADDFGLLLKHPVMLALHLFMLCLLLAGFVGSLIRKRPDTPDSRFFAGYLACVPLLLFAMRFLGFGQSFVERSALVAMPFFFILVANGVFTMRLRVLRLGLVLVLGVVCFSSLTAYFLKPDQWTVYKPNPDWRSAANFLSAKLDSAQGGVAVLAKTPAYALKYYDHRFNELDDWTDRQSLQNARFTIRYLNNAPSGEEPALAFTEQPETLYLIHNRYWSFDLARARKNISRRLGLREDMVKEFNGLQVFVYRK